MWDLLVWQGKHAQAPVAVAAKPHYFSELDVNKSMRNILNRCPEFFASEQFLSSVSNGTITALDRAFFCQVRVHPVSSFNPSRPSANAGQRIDLQFTGANSAMPLELQHQYSRHMSLNISITFASYHTCST